MKNLMLFFVLFFYASPSSAQTLQDIKWMTEEYAPYNFTVDGTPTGIAVDILVEMWRKSGLQKDLSSIEVVPWARGYNITQEDPKACLFSMTITDERKQLFTFVGPSLVQEVAIIAEKAKGLRINSIDDLKTLSIGTVREDIGEQLLLNAGLPMTSIDGTDSAESLIRKLDAERNDAIAYGVDTTFFNMRELRIDTDRFEVIYSLKKGEMGYAFNKNVNPTIIEPLQKALDELITDGTVEKIRQKYIN